MNKVFFAGNHFLPGGPNEVNKNLIKVLCNRVSYLKCSNPRIRIFEKLFKLCSCDIIIFSGISAFELWFVRFAKLLRKPVIYIMHGCLELETNRKHKVEMELLRLSSLILCVSQTYFNIIKNKYPQYASKMDVLTNGIDWAVMEKIALSTAIKQPNRILLMGGGRTVKRNLQVCKAVEELNKTEHFNLKVDVYGYYRDNDDSQEISSIPCVTFHHVIPRNELLSELRKTTLFIQNSEFESFSLGVVEALLCGCDLLISKNVGARDVISALEEDDIISDPFNIEEIKHKIQKVLNTPNNGRLLNSISHEATSIEKAGDKLFAYCKKVKDEN